MMKQKSAVEAWRYITSRHSLTPNKTKWMFDTLTEYGDYILFLTQDLTLADFVPCEKIRISQFGIFKYIPLEKPNMEAGFTPDEMDKIVEEYQQALDRVVYEGWEVLDRQTLKRRSFKDYIKIGDSGYLELTENKIEWYETTRAIKTREDMVGFEMRDEVAKKLNLM